MSPFIPYCILAIAVGLIIALWHLFPDDEEDYDDDPTEYSDWD